MLGFNYTPPYVDFRSRLDYSPKHAHVIHRLMHPNINLQSWSSRIDRTQNHTQAYLSITRNI